MRGRKQSNEKGERPSFWDEEPEAIARLGRSTFVTMPAYRIDPRAVRVVYVDRELMSELVGGPVSMRRAKQLVRDHLLLTVDPGVPRAEREPVQVFVDRQADPMEMSLNDNLGSGRAAYVGRWFNLKGLGKTVLATSTDPSHSNGVLDLVSALWEMVCSNTLSTNMRTGSIPILAVVDLGKEVSVPWREGKFPSGMLVRVDRHGELDRPTHLFQAGKPVPRRRLNDIARCLGKQDAEKLIERVLHGAWSAGNVSSHGHMVDHDTMFAVRGRAPQWCYRPNWMSNFFGHEGEGQMELLNALAEHRINVDNVSTGRLRRVFRTARREQLHHRFLELTGLPEQVVRQCLDEQGERVRCLADQFETLAMKMFPHFAATAAWDPDNACLHVYDFSRFFRFHHLLGRSASARERLALLKNPWATVKTSRETRDGGMPRSLERRMRRLHVVETADQRRETDREARSFLAELARLYRWVEERDLSGADEMAARAYVINEERTYLNCRPGDRFLTSLVDAYRSGRMAPGRLSELLALVIEASDRRPRFAERGRNPADLRLASNGYTSNLLDRRGRYQARLTLLGRPGTGTAWHIEIGGRRCRCTVERSPGRTHVLGPSRPLADLATSRRDVRFYRDGRLFELRPVPTVPGDETAAADRDRIWPGYLPPLQD